ncbi:MAG TPA: septum formation initiator family protein [Terriglobales bacterium]|nr:septum formation initiator family protein [Terriglobales bacterium]
MDLRLNGLAKIRILPTPEDGLRAVVNHAPQAEAAFDRLTERLRPTWNLLYRLRRRVATAAVLMLTAWLFLHVTFGANGMVVYKQKRAAIKDLQQQVDALQKENDRYTDQIKALKSDPQAIEKEAREQLHYARPGEVVYVPPAAATPQKPDTKAAKK